MSYIGEKMTVNVTNIPMFQEQLDALQLLINDIKAQIDTIEINKNANTTFVESQQFSLTIDTNVVNLTNKLTQKEDFVNRVSYNGEGAFVVKTYYNYFDLGANVIMDPTDWYFSYHPTYYTMSALNHEMFIFCNFQLITTGITGDLHFQIRDSNQQTNGFDLSSTTSIGDRGDFKKIITLKWGTTHLQNKNYVALAIRCASSTSVGTATISKVTWSAFEIK